MVDGAAAISWCTMLTDVLDAPVTKLAMRNDVNASKDLFNAWALKMLAN
jgi:hypothetical protein